jgi:hypothetical protein
MRFGMSRLLRPSILISITATPLHTTFLLLFFFSFYRHSTHSMTDRTWVIIKGELAICASPRRGGVVRSPNACLLSAVLYDYPEYGVMTSEKYGRPDEYRMFSHYGQVV